MKLFLEVLKAQTIIGLGLVVFSAVVFVILSESGLSLLLTIPITLRVFMASFAYDLPNSPLKNKESKRLSGVPGNYFVQAIQFLVCKKRYEEMYLPIILDMREEYFEALSQNRIWKARWVRVRGTWSFFAAMGLDRALAFVPFFVKVWKSVN